MYHIYLYTHTISPWFECQKIAALRVFLGPSFPNFGAIFRLEAELPNYENSLGILSHEISRNMPKGIHDVPEHSYHKKKSKQRNCLQNVRFAMVTSQANVVTQFDCNRISTTKPGFSSIGA